MKKYSFLFLLFLFSLQLVIAQGDGIQFNSAKWQEILDLAKQEEKLIFVDAYTTWCGPCKKMTKEIFPLPKVGQFYNDNFINVKMDMEKGEGVQLASDYDVVVYPTLLYIASDGTLVHRVAGYHSEDQFLEVGAIASDPARNLAAMERRYNSGDRDADFLLNYTKVRWEAMDGSHTKVAEAYLDTQKDWATEDHRQFIMNYCDDADSKLFTYLTENKADFLQQFEEKDVLSKIQNLVYNKIYNKKDITLDEINGLFTKAYPEKAEQLSSHYRMTYYRNRGDREGFATSALDHYAKYPSKDASELNDIAWTFYEVIGKAIYLEGAVGLAEQSIKLDKGYYNMDTLAALQYKLGNRKKALKYAKKAIKLAKKSEEDYSLTEELIAQIKGQL